MVLGLFGLVIVAVIGAAGAVVLDRVADGGRADQAELGPVLVVPGYGGKVSSVDAIVDALRDSGRDVTVVESIGDGTGDLSAQAQNLGTVARDAMEEAGADSVDVVGYSAGGVVARLWVADEGGATIARRVLSIGSPHHGTDVAALALEVAGDCPTACEQLAPDSDLLRVLNAGDETPEGPEWITVASTSDAVVTPTDSSRLDGALNVVVQEFCPDRTTSHGQLPEDPVVLETLDSVLGPAAPRIPVRTDCG